MGCLDDPGLRRELSYCTCSDDGESSQIASPETDTVDTSKETETDDVDPPAETEAAMLDFEAADAGCRHLLADLGISES